MRPRTRDLNVTFRPDGQTFLQQERYPAERQVAREDLMRAVRARPIEDLEHSPALQRFAVVATPVGCCRNGDRRTDLIETRHQLPPSCTPCEPSACPLR